MENVAFVTGAGGYLGGDIARRFAKNGMKVALCDINEESMKETLADITEEQKNDISHRGKALRAMSAWLKDNMSE